MATSSPKTERKRREKTGVKAISGTSISEDFPRSSVFFIARRGLVIAISSVAGFAPLLARTGYAASKHALHGLFDTLRAEVAPQGVGVLIVCPSFIRTEIAAAHLAGDGQAARHPRAVVGDMLDPGQVAARIVAAPVGRIAWSSYWISRLAPRLYERLMVRKMAREMPEAESGQR